MDKKPEPILTCDLGENGGKVVFTSFEDVQQWVQKERNFWQWLNDQTRSDQHLRQLWDRVHSYLIGMEQQLINGRQSLTDPTWKGHLTGLQQRILDCYSKSPNALPHSESARGRFIDELKTVAPASAAYATAYFMGNNSQPIQALAFRGLFEAYLFDHGLLAKGARDSANVEIKAMRDLRAQWDNTIKGLNTEATIVQNQFIESQNKADTLLTEHRRAHDELVKAHGEAFAKGVEEGKGRLKEIGDAYDSFMVLQAPVTYWEGEQENHQTQAKRYGQRSAVFGVLVMAAVSLAVWLVVGEETAVGKIPLWRVGALVAIVTGVIWVERILVRMYLSHAHLATDAGERVAMAKTYLALVRDGKITDDKDRRVILEALFRKASDGIVKDDAAPPSLFEAVTRQR